MKGRLNSFLIYFYVPASLALAQLGGELIFIGKKNNQVANYNKRTKNVELSLFLSMMFRQAFALCESE